MVKKLFNYILHLYLINVFWKISSNNCAANYATFTLTMPSKSYQYNYVTGCKLNDCEYMKIIHMNYQLRNEHKSDFLSDENYLISSKNMA